MLPAVRDLVKRQGLVSVQEVALHLGIPAEVARALLQKWVNKGRIAPVPTPPGCIGCTLCDSAPRELYRWCGDAAGRVDASSRGQSETGRSTKVPSACPAAGPSQGQG